MLGTLTTTPFPQNLIIVLIYAFCVLLSISLHELSHGLAAYASGDNTAKYTGRLSLNPLHHMDPFGALCLFLFGFGWAKPVPVNPRNFKNPKLGMVVTALAGPLSNFILAFIAQFIAALIGKLTFSSDSSLGYSIAIVAYMICVYLAQLSLGLGIFNLIPIPPLDGSKVLNAILPARLYFKYMQYERYGFIALILLINLPVFSSLLYSCRGAILGFFDIIIGLII